MRQMCSHVLGDDKHDAPKSDGGEGELEEEKEGGKKGRKGKRKKKKKKGKGTWRCGNPDCRKLNENYLSRVCAFCDMEKPLKVAWADTLCHLSGK